MLDRAQGDIAKTDPAAAPADLAAASRPVEFRGAGFAPKAGRYSGWIALVLAVGSVGIAGVGTLLATMSVNTTGKDFVLAVLFIPVMFPLLLAVVAATSVVLTATPNMAVFWQMVAVAAGYDTIMLLAAYALYEFILGA